VRSRSCARLSSEPVVGAALMCVPGGAPLAVVAMMGLGLAAAPVFPLLALTTAQRLSPANSPTRVVGLHVAASAIGARGAPGRAWVWQSAYSVRTL
jgi:hypothetical protein